MVVVFWPVVCGGWLFWCLGLGFVVFWWFSGLVVVGRLRVFMDLMFWRVLGFEFCVTWCGLLWLFGWVAGVGGFG